MKDGKILAVGSLADMNAYKGDATKVFDLAGKALLPGFLDAHSHYISSLTVANQVNVYPPPAGPGKDPASIVTALVKFRIKKTPHSPDVVIQAYGYDDTVMPNDKLLTRMDLDEEFPDNPVLVGHVSMHGAVMNSAALKKWNITADTPTPPGGVIVRDPGTNEPIGLIMETAYEPVFKSLPKPAPEEEIQWSLAGQMLYAQAGITTAQEGATHAGDLEIMERVAKAGTNIIDIIALPFITDLDKVLDAHPVSDWGKYDNRLKIGGVKITIDGSPQGRTAYFSTPYLTGGPNGELEWRGELTAPGNHQRGGQEGLPPRRAALPARQWGCRDRHLLPSPRVRGGERPGEGSARHADPRPVHPQGPARQVREVQDHAVLLHAAHLLLRRGPHRQPGRAAGGVHQPDAGRDQEGVAPTNHTDFVVAPLDQMFMLWSAVNRISRVPPRRQVIGPDQCVTPLEGLKAMTINVAYQYGEQDSKGSLEPGKLADLVILDQNPLKVDPMAIKDIKVVATIKEGKTIYHLPPTPPTPPTPRASSR